MLPVVGARECVFLPELELGPVQARIDTGAATSALHVVHIQVEGSHVVFDAVLGDGTLQPCRAHLIEWRWVKDSGGHPTLRPVIRTRFELGGHAWDDELTLAHREGLRHRMLVGRRALRGRFLVDVGMTHVLTKPC